MVKLTLQLNPKDQRLRHNRGHLQTFVLRHEGHLSRGLSTNGICSSKEVAPKLSQARGFVSCSASPACILEKSMSSKAGMVEVLVTSASLLAEIVES